MATTGIVLQHSKRFLNCVVCGVCTKIEQRAMKLFEASCSDSLLLLDQRRRAFATMFPIGAETSILGGKSCNMGCFVHL